MNVLLPLPYGISRQKMGHNNTVRNVAGITKERDGAYLHTLPAPPPHPQANSHVDVLWKLIKKSKQRFWELNCILRI